MAPSPVEGLRLRGSTVFDPEAQTRGSTSSPPRGESRGRELAEVPAFAGRRSGLVPFQLSIYANCIVARCRDPLP